MTDHERAKEAAEYLEETGKYEVLEEYEDGKRFVYARFPTATVLHGLLTDQGLISLAIRNGWNPPYYFANVDTDIYVSVDDRFIEYNGILYERVKK